MPELRAFQEESIAYGVGRLRTFLCDPPGCGKTAEALTAIAALDAFPCTIVVPAHLRINWYRECAKWLPGVPVEVIGMRNKTPTYCAPITIVSYVSLSRHVSHLKAQAVVYDELHLSKSEYAQRTAACKRLAYGVPIRLGLTGTPVVNRPNELPAQLDILGRLDDLGGRKRFHQRYCAAYQGDTTGASRLAELHERMTQTCYIRHEKRDVLPQLPPKRRIVVPLEIDNEPTYREAERDFLGYVSRTYGADRAQRAGRQAELTRITELRQLAAQGKLRDAREWLVSRVAEGEKVLVFAQHKHVVQAVSDALRAPSITGETPQAERQRLVDQFQSDPSCRALVCNTKAAGVGLTLTAATSVVFVELGWTPAEHDQAEDRAYGRLLDPHGVTCYYLVAGNTVEDRMAQIIDRKRRVVDYAHTGKEEQQFSIIGSLIEELKEAA